jgi:hypothetical protein
VTRVVGVSCSDDGDGAPTTSQTRTEPPTSPAEAPVEFSACIHPGPGVHSGTNGRLVVPLSNREMTIVRERGATWRQSLSKVSVPAWGSDVYTLPGDEAEVPNFISADDPFYLGPTVMTAEGAFEGPTAIVGLVDGDGGDCHISGYIVEGTIPRSPVPQPAHSGMGSTRRCWDSSPADRPPTTPTMSSSCSPPRGETPAPKRRSLGTGALASTWRSSGDVVRLFRGEPRLCYAMDRVRPCAASGLTFGQPPGSEVRR